MSDLIEELPIGRLLNHLIDRAEIDAKAVEGLLADLQLQGPDPRKIAMELDPKDFEGAPPNVRIGLAYMKGRMENLEADLERARAYAVQLKETHQRDIGKLVSEKWRVESELRAANAELEKYRPTPEDPEDEE